MEVSESMARIIRSKHWKEIINDESERRTSTEDGQRQQEAITDGKPNGQDRPEPLQAVPEQRQGERKTTGLRKVSTKKKAARRKS